MNINKKDPMEIFVDGNKIILKKYEPGCEYCGSMDGLIEFEDRHICIKCIEKLKEKAEE
jgi:transcriptional pleiotropic regulator of transition state genes